MKKRAVSAQPNLDQLAIECVHFDAQDRPVERRVVPLLALMRSLNVTLPVQSTFRADRPGAI